MLAKVLLIVDDEPQIRRVVRNAFKEDVQRILEAERGADGIDLAAAEQPDLIILDLGLPDLPGLEVCREIRKWSSVPVVVLTARHSEEEKVTLLDAGADDYLTKPFSPAELQARVRAVLRRASGGVAPANRLEQDGLVMDLHQRELRRDGRPIHLTPIEWELLRVLMSQPGRTLTHQQLFRAVWTGRAYGDAQQYLRVYVAHLRRKIEDDPVRPHFIVTEPGVGYRFAGQP